MKQKILVFAGATFVFGAEKVTLNVIDGLHKKGYDLKILISSWNNGDFIRRLGNISIQDFETISLGWYYITKLLWSLDSLINYPKSILKFRRIIKQYKPNVIYTTSFRPILLLFPFMNTKIIYNVQDPNSESKSSRFFIKLIDKKVTKYTACSAFIKLDLISCGIEPNKIDIIHNGVDVNEGVLEKTLNSDNLSKFNVGIAGQIIPRKGHDDVIEAFRLLKENGNSCQLTIVGKGDDDFILDLKRKIHAYDLGESVFWKGYKVDPKEIYDSIDLLLAPSLNNEPFALVVLEAGALGIPSIVSNRGGFPESIIDGYNGFIVNANSPAQIAAKIEVLIKNPTLLDEMRTNAKLHIAKNFSNVNMINKLEKTINSL